ncbi:MAG TPA: LUD domain-containing protein [Parafilimonas sp.]|nr:LUD domain-containing protein [Parafilimonas sp.]
MESSAKKNILKKIKQALATPVPVPFSHQSTVQILNEQQQETEVEFAEKFTSLQGRFSFCFDNVEMVNQLKTLFAARNWEKIFIKDDALQQTLQSAGLNINYTNNLAKCDAAITTCECLIARTGSIVLSAAQQSGRTVSVYAPVHICIAYTNQLVYDIKDGLELVQNKYHKNLPSLITFATGPSRTADIEKTLVTGVHGPKEVFCFLIQAENT